MDDREVKRLQHRVKAQQMWDAMDENAQAGVRFGMFPAVVMRQAEAEKLWDSHLLCVCLMDVATANGGMRA